MVIETNIGNFGSLKDLEIFMRSENHNKVIIDKATALGMNWKIMKNLELSYAEVLKASKIS